MSTGTVAGLYRYPVKSMLGETLDRAEIDGRGVLGDRAHAVIDQSDGKVASAKHPTKWRRLLEVQADYVDEVTSREATPPVELTFPDGTVVRSDDDNVHDKLSLFVGRDVSLAAVGTTGAVLEEVWPDIEGLAPAEFIAATATGTTEAGESVSDISMGLAAPPGTFFDVATLHMLTTSTLDALRAAGDADFDVRRYRPNVLVDTVETGFVENGWAGQIVALGKSCTATVDLSTMRCVMTTLAQTGMAADRETLRVIARANRVDIPGLGTWACAGVYATPQELGAVALGDAVAVG
ncbi:MAG: uncharacterized protein QOG87_1146 [Actinomycetota bacterium]|jgi:uncharacterized protein YcbX